jgi:hypothetical protein
MASSVFAFFAYGAFIVNVLFGLAVKSGVVPRGRYRRVHHAIYAAVMASLAAAIVAAIVRGDGTWLRLAAMAVILSAMPRFRGAGRAHWMYATFALVVYSLVVFG